MKPDESTQRHAEKATAAKAQKATVPEIAVAEPEESTGLPGGFRLEVTGPDGGRPTLHVIDAPFALIGRAKGCGLRLNHPAVSHRHTYLQAVFGRIYCVNLTSHGQTLWSDGPRKADWFELDETIAHRSLQGAAR